MRLYSFVNGNYLNSGQHGIQTGHAAVRIALMQDNHIAAEWSQKHETFIILNAHNYAGLQNVTEKLGSLIDMYNLMVKDSRNKIPYVSFFEDIESLNGMQTCFACVLPENFYAEIPELDRDLARQRVSEYWEGVEKHYCMAHTEAKYRDLIMCTVKGYNLVQL